MRQGMFNPLTPRQIGPWFVYARIAEQMQRYSFIHSFISTAPLQGHYYSEEIPTQDGFCAWISRRSATWDYYQGKRYILPICKCIPCFAVSASRIPLTSSTADSRFHSIEKAYSGNWQSAQNRFTKFLAFAIQDIKCPIEYRPSHSHNYAIWGWHSQQFNHCLWLCKIRQSWQ